MKIVVFSAHPDDAETGVGGFCTCASKSGHEVLINHMSKEVRGRKFNGIPESKVRVSEAKEAVQILYVKVDLEWKVRIRQRVLRELRISKIEEVFLGSE
jgi:LmbE family N-acetylglucosaminyl deacetylase